jgi:hypothetical protein
MDKQRAKKMLEMTNRLRKIDESTLSPQQLKQHRRMVEAIRSELKALREGASAEDVQRAIINRIMIANHDLLAKYGPQKIIDASMEVAEFHAGAEELGTSDISIMVREVARNLEEQNQGVEEGLGHQILAGAALLAALWGVNNHVANDAYNNSPQLQQLVKLHQAAEASGNTAKAKELEQRIENHKTRLDLGKGEVMGQDGNPIQVKEHADDGDVTPVEQSTDDSEAVEMAMGDLKNLGQSVESVMSMLKQRGELPAWCASYITLANDHVESIKEYLASKQQGEEGENEIVDVDSPAGATDREAYERMRKVFDFSNFKG